MTALFLFFLILFSVVVQILLHRMIDDKCRGIGRQEGHILLAVIGHRVFVDTPERVFSSLSS